MPSRRAQIRMSDDEVATFLDGRHNMAVATLGPTGHPHLVAMWCLRQQATKRVAVFVDVEDVASWDHRKLGGTY